VPGGGGVARRFPRAAVSRGRSDVSPRQGTRNEHAKMGDVARETRPREGRLSARAGGGSERAHGGIAASPSGGTRDPSRGPSLRADVWPRGRRKEYAVRVIRPRSATNVWFADEDEIPKIFGEAASVKLKGTVGSIFCSYHGSHIKVAELARTLFTTDWMHRRGKFVFDGTACLSRCRRKPKKEAERRSRDIVITNEKTRTLRDPRTPQAHDHHAPASSPGLARSRVSGPPPEEPRFRRSNARNPLNTRSEVSSFGVAWVSPVA
jgi:hypothetical protein